METIGGYSNEFVDPVPEDYYCPVCLQVLRDAQLTSCCGYHFCFTCIETVYGAGKPCPRCKNADFTILLDRQLTSRIKALKVYCKFKQEGCQWEGPLEQLETHLNDGKAEGECDILPVKCPLGCGCKMARSMIQTHQEHDCPRREFSCEHCQLDGNFQEITQTHYNVCHKYPTECTNGCGEATMQRCELQDHLAICPLEEMACEFDFAGCTAKMKRKDVDNHLKENVHHHLVQVVSESRKTEQRNRNLKRRYAELEESISEFQHKVVCLKESSESDSESDSDVRVWVKVEDGKRRSSTRLYVGSDAIIYDIIKKALKKEQVECTPGLVWVIFGGNEIRRGALVTEYRTTFDNPLLLQCRMS